MAETVEVGATGSVARVAPPVFTGAALTKAASLVWEFWPMRSYGWRPLDGDETLLLASILAVIAAAIAGGWRRITARRQERWEIRRAEKWIAIREKLGPAYPIEAPPPTVPLLRPDS